MTAHEPLQAADPPPGQGLMQPRFIRANGLEFAYLQAGAEDAPLVLLLHGFPDTAWSFAGLVQSFGQAGFRAVAPFMRGYPPSSIPEDRDYSASMLGRDVIALAEHFGVQEVRVVGHDWGAVAAYAAAALRPDRVKAIVAASVPHLRRFLLRPTRHQLRASHYMFKFQLPGWPEKRIRENDFAWLKELVQSWSPGWEVTEEYFAPVKAAFSDPARLRAALAYYRALPGALFGREAWRLILKPIEVPARVVYGARDGCILPEMYRGCEHLFAADYSLSQIADAGHFVHLEAPAQFAETVIEFLRR
jgi:pimeloyl-ACP methyl ester carboxylesterase